MGSTWFVLWSAWMFISVNSLAFAPKIKMNDGRDIPSLAFGTWLGNGTQGRIVPHNNDTEEAVRWAIDAGYRHIDTAKAYLVEDQVGRAVNAKLRFRDDVFVTTKLWNDQHARDNVVPALRESLSQLKMDYVDLYLIHWPLGMMANGTYDYTDYLDTWQGMMEAKRLGLAKSIGVSNFNQDMIERILENDLEKPAVNQVEINLNLQQPELLDYCKRNNIVVMGYTPFGSLFREKAKPDAPPPRVDDPALVKMASKYNKTVPQLVLRYLYELGVIPIPKSLTKSRIEQNIEIFDFSLAKEDRNELKKYDRNYRTIQQCKWSTHPYYPFELEKCEGMCPRTIIDYSKPEPKPATPTPKTKSKK